MAVSGSALFYWLRCLWQTRFTTRAFNVLRQYPTPTTIFILPMLLLLAFCFYRTTRDLGLGVSCLSYIQNWYCCNDARLPQLPELQPRRRSKKQHSVTPLSSVVVAPVDESARKTATTLPTRLHNKNGQRDCGCAAMGVSVIFVSRDGCVTSCL